MSWDVSLKRVNAGMPRTVEDMYGLKEQSLYLIKVGIISHSKREGEVEKDGQGEKSEWGWEIP